MHVFNAQYQIEIVGISLQTSLPALEENMPLLAMRVVLMDDLEETRRL
ncbi:hypothetical protein [Sodalis-like endosymbiont of Proechinophthirus fluctus]|nr:hypothetical protein [Sodalis-like endosymbiont of Proechinophthirus fluctus]